MARLLLSKSTLLKEKKSLESYKRFLPSLEMKRQQLMAAVKDNQQQLLKLEEGLSGIQSFIAEQIPMLANVSIDLEGLVEIETINHKRVNVVGVWLYEIESIDFVLPEVYVLAKPHWVDVTQQKLKEALHLQVALEIEKYNEERLRQETNKVTQRVKLFDKVLIPETRANMRKIQLFLDDKDREMVVTSKLSKNKRQQTIKKQYQITGGEL